MIRLAWLLPAAFALLELALILSWLPLWAMTQTPIRWRGRG